MLPSFNIKESKILSMETKEIIYLVAFALILHIVYKLVMKIRKEKYTASEWENNQNH